MSAHDAAQHAAILELAARYRAAALAFDQAQETCVTIEHQYGEAKHVLDDAKALHEKTRDDLLRAAIGDGS